MIKILSQTENSTKLTESIIASQTKLIHGYLTDNRYDRRTDDNMLVDGAYIRSLMLVGKERMIRAIMVNGECVWIQEKSL